MGKKIILDCDPGHDDAVAILLALGNPTIDLLGVTTVGGNQSLDKVTYNARAVLEKAHATDVPVHMGCGRPLIREPEAAATIHGQSGLDGVELPVPSRPLDEGHAVNWIIDTIMSNPPQTITLVPTGPLTNIALAARLEPRIVDRVKEVVLMGGGYHVGNWSAVAEFNVKVDPEAAHIVFNETWPLTMVGLDLTHQRCARPLSNAAWRTSAPIWPRSSVGSWTSSARPTARTRTSSTLRCTTRAQSRTSSTPL